MSILKKNLCNAGCLRCAPHQFSPPSTLAAPTFKEVTALLCVFHSFLFGLLYLQTFSLSEARFPPLLSEDAMQGDTNLSLTLSSLLFLWEVGLATGIHLNGQV